MRAELEVILSEAAQIARDSRENLKRESKPDGSVVTNGDRAVETFLRQKLPALVPAAIWGEEFGREEANGSGQWLIDPIDGTTNYAWGSPMWGISVGLMRAGEVVLGGVILPDLGELYSALVGEGVYLNGGRLSEIVPGVVHRSDPIGYCEAVARLGHKLPGKQRCGGAFVIEGAFVAAGRLRGLIGLRERLYDVAPCILFGNELGMEVRYADGEPLDYERLSRGEPFARPWIIFPKESGFRI